MPLLGLGLGTSRTKATHSSLPLFFYFFHSNFALQSASLIVPPVTSQSNSLACSFINDCWRSGSQCPPSRWRIRTYSYGSSLYNINSPRSWSSSPVSAHGLVIFRVRYQRAFLLTPSAWDVWEEGEDGHWPLSLMADGSCLLST